MASGFTVATNEHFIRANLYSREITRMFQDDLFAMRCTLVSDEVGRNPPELIDIDEIGDHFNVFFDIVIIIGRQDLSLKFS